MKDIAVALSENLGDEALVEVVVVDEEHTQLPLWGSEERKGLLRGEVQACSSPLVHQSGEWGKRRARRCEGVDRLAFVDLEANDPEWRGELIDHKSTAPTPPLLSRLKGGDHTK